MKNVLYLSFVLWISIQAQASKYSCSFDKINGTVDNLGKIEVESGAPGFKKVTITEEGDFGACGFSKPPQGQPNGKQTLTCVFAGKESAPLLKNLNLKNPKSLLFLGKTRLFGQFSNTPASITLAGAENLGLMVVGQDALFSAYCLLKK